MRIRVGRTRMLWVGMLWILMMLWAGTAFAAGTAEAAESAGAAEKKLTLMIYMCGSNLESSYGAASADMEEIRNTAVNDAAVNVLLMTGGSTQWRTGQEGQELLIRRLRYVPPAQENRWMTCREMPARSMGDAETLCDFIAWSMENYPAERYALILWDHGAGPLEGVCLDEPNTPDRLSLQELTDALSACGDGQKLSWIGFDACLMSTAEVAQAVSPWAEYMIASQETEPAEGWDYCFLEGIENDVDGAETGRRIVDAYFDSQGENTFGLTLSCLRLSAMEKLAREMSRFFEPVSRTLNRERFAELSTLRTASVSFGKVVRALTTAGYDLVDLGDLIDHFREMGNVSSLQRALREAVEYHRPEEVSGLSVYHPLKNKAGYEQAWKDAYQALNFSTGYQKYLNSFGTLLVGKELADWSAIALRDEGYGPAGGNLFTMELTPLQLEYFSSAQLIILGALGNSYSSEAVYDVQLAGAGAAEGDYVYYPVTVEEIQPDAEGRITAEYLGSSLYVTDETGRAVAGPIGYQRSDDGQYVYIRAEYVDNSGKEHPAENVKVLYTCVTEADGHVRVVNTEVYDPLTDTYTRRIAFDEADYTEMQVDLLSRALPKTEEVLPGFAEWPARWTETEIALPLDWGLRFYEEQLSGTQLFAMLQITDVQQNSYCTAPIPVENPNLYDIDILPRTLTGDGYEVTLYAVQDHSALHPGLSIRALFHNTSRQKMNLSAVGLVFNGTRSVGYAGNLYVYNMEPGASKYDTVRLDNAFFMGLGELTELSLRVEVEAADSRDRVATAYDYQLRLSGCDPAEMALDTALARDETRTDVLWELVSLERNAKGGLSGTLHVVNSGDQKLYGSYYAVVNDCVETDEPIYLSVEAGQDLCIPFEMDNGVVSNYGLNIKGTIVRRFLALDHLMERHGVREIRSLKFCRLDLHDQPEAFTFQLPEPLKMGSEPQPGQEWKEAEKKEMLLEGDVGVALDRVLVADDGIALRLIVANHTERDRYFAIRFPEVNGKSFALGLPLAEYPLGAGATLYTNVVINTYLQTAVQEISLCFTCDQYMTHPAVIHLTEAAPYGQEGGFYLSGASLQVTPADNSKPEARSVPLQSPLLAEAGAEVNLTLDLVNNQHYYTRESVDATTALEARLHVRNASDSMLAFSFSDLMINDIRFIEQKANIYKLQPGAETDCSIQLGSTEMANLREIHSISMDVTVEWDQNRDSRRAGAARADGFVYPVTLISPVWPDVLAETETDGLTLRVISLAEGADGRLEGVLHLRNQTGAPLEDQNVPMALNGLALSTVRAKLPAGAERYMAFTWKNSISDRFEKKEFAEDAVPDTGHILQRLGEDAVRTVSLTLHQDKKTYQAGPVLTAELAEPVALSEIPVPDLCSAKDLMTGEITVSVAQIITSSKGVALTAVIRNRSDEARYVRVLTPEGNGYEMDVSALDAEVLLAPGQSAVQPVLLSFKDPAAEEVLLREIRLSLRVNELLMEDAVILSDEPLSTGRAEVRTAESFSVIPTAVGTPVPALMEKMGIPYPAGLSPITLTAPVEAEKAARFASGMATVCRKRTSYRNEEGEYIQASGLEELCRLPLTEENGEIRAEWSGLLMGLIGLPAYAEQTLLKNGDTEFRLTTVFYLKDAAYDAAQKGRLTARGQGILAEKTWTVGSAAEGLPIRDTALKLTDLETGEILPEGDIPLSLLDRIAVEYPMLLEENEAWQEIWQVSTYSGPVRTSLLPARQLVDQLTVCFEIHDRNGGTEWIVDDAALSAALAKSPEEPEIAEEKPAENTMIFSENGRIAVTPGEVITDQVRIALSIQLTKTKTQEKDGTEERILPNLCISVENLSGDVINTSATPFVLNGMRETESRWIAYNIGPGETYTDAWPISDNDLQAIGTLERISCTMNLFLPKKQNEPLASVPLDVALEPLESVNLAARYLELGGEGVYGIEWELKEIALDAYGRITGTLRAVNQTSHEWTFKRNMLLVQGISGNAAFSDFTLSPHRSKDISFVFENQVSPTIGETRYFQMEELLQRHGIAQVTEMTFCLGMKGGYENEGLLPQQTITIHLAEPLSLPEAASTPRERKQLLAEGNTSVWLESILIEKEAVSLGLELVNDADQAVNIEVLHVYLDGSDTNAYEGVIVPAHSASDVSVMLYRAYGSQIEQPYIHALHLCFALSDGWGQYRYCSGAQIELLDPGGKNDEIWWVSGCDVTAATPAAENPPGLADAVCAVPASWLTQRHLTAPLDAEQVSRFAGGEVSLLWRWVYEYDGGAECLSQEIIRIPLTGDRRTVSADYSGMTLSLGGMPVPAAVRMDGDETVLSATMYFVKGYEGENLLQVNVSEDGTVKAVLADNLSDAEDGSDEQVIQANLILWLVPEEGRIRETSREISYFNLRTGAPAGAPDRTCMPLFIRTDYTGDDYTQPIRFFDGYMDAGWLTPSVSYAEAYDEQLLLRYQIRYTDGTEEVTVVPYANPDLSE